MKSFIILISCIFINTFVTLAQLNKFSFSGITNYGFNAGLISNGINSGTYTGWNMYSDDNYNLFQTIDYYGSLNYQLSNFTSASIGYRRYNLNQIYTDGDRDMYLKISSKHHSFFLNVTRYWNKNKFSPFSAHGLIFLFDSNKEKVTFKSDYPSNYLSYYERTRNFKSYSIVNYIISNSFGLNHKISDKISLDYFLDFNLGVRNLYTNLVVFVTKDSTSIGYEGNVTAMNKGDKFGLGIRLNYNLSNK
jgi:hypothetical protein